MAGRGGSRCAGVAAGGLLLWKPWQPAALAGVTENSIGVIDTDRAEVIGEIQVGTRPGGIAVGEGYAWVTNTGEDSVSQIDLDTGAVITRIGVGRSPVGIAVAEGSVWVANSGDRTITRINAELVGWSASRSTSGTGRRRSPLPAPSFGWPTPPTARSSRSMPRPARSARRPAWAQARSRWRPIETAVWVVSEDGASVSQLDPVTGVTLAAPIQLAVRPTGIALDAESAWVSAADGTVTRIDRAGNRIMSTIDIGGPLTAIAVSADGSGSGRRRAAYISWIRPVRRPCRNRSRPAARSVPWPRSRGRCGSPPRRRRPATGEAPCASCLPMSWRSIRWMGIPQHPGLQADGLVGYRRAGGSAGGVLLPALATTVPRPTDGGLTYTFRLRPGLEYSTGMPVRAADFRRAIERSFQVDAHRGSRNVLLLRDRRRGGMHD